jgi:hypothetical protein
MSALQSLPCNRLTKSCILVAVVAQPLRRSALFGASARATAAIAISPSLSLAVHQIPDLPPKLTGEMAMKTTMILAMAGMLASAPAAALVTAVSGGVQWQSSVKMNDVVTLGNLSQDNWAVLNPGVTYTANSQAEAVGANFQGVQRRYSYGNAGATWESASKGSFGANWGFASEGSGGGYVANDALRPNWSYTFTLDAPGTFTYNFRVAHELVKGISTFGVNGFFLETSLGPQDYNAGYILDDVDPFFEGGGAIGFGAGTHTVTLFNIQRVSSGINPREAFGVQSFNWEILPGVTAVPEPASWAMLIAGFGLTGVSMRRRQAQLRRVTA